MKLVEIKDIRPGQIWKDDEGYLILIGLNLNGTWYNSKGVPSMGGMELYDTVHHKLIGKLGITHRIEGNRLVEIPREAEIQIDDVFRTMIYTKSPLAPNFDIGCDFTYAISVVNFVEDNIVFDYLNEEYLSENLERIGILGVTHEFVNDREV